MSDIVERLKSWSDCRYVDGESSEELNADATEAASEITRLREEVDALRAIAERLNDGRVIIDEELTWEMMKNLPSGEPF